MPPGGGGRSRLALRNDLTAVIESVPMAVRDVRVDGGPPVRSLPFRHDVLKLPRHLQVLLDGGKQIVDQAPQVRLGLSRVAKRTSAPGVFEPIDDTLMTLDHGADERPIERGALELAKIPELFLIRPRRPQGVLPRPSILSGRCTNGLHLALVL